MSHNSLIVASYKTLVMQDNLASTVVDDSSPNTTDGVLVGDNTEDISVLDGPTAYLPRSFNFSLHQITMAEINENPIGRSFSFWIRGDVSHATTSRFLTYLSGNQWALVGVYDDHVTFWIRQGTRTDNFITHDMTAWRHCVAVFGQADQRFYIDGAEVFSSTVTYATTTLAPLALGYPPPTNTDQRFIGNAAGYSHHNSVLTAANVLELYNGPEPVNTVAPVLSGTEVNGRTLSCTEGTWSLDSPFSLGSNGTTIISYQWTRSDDAVGTNEADISGETTSTYLLASADLTKFVRCRVRATNAGGFDSDADTESNMSGAVLDDIGVGRWTSGSLYLPGFTSGQVIP